MAIRDSRSKPDPNFWRGRRVLLTGRTGFKGSWLLLWLQELGAVITGLALPPDTNPSLFTQLGLEPGLKHREGDICGAAILFDLVAITQPEVVLHLAAQPLVRRSYEDPLGTWATNVQGFLHLLEALKLLQHACAVVMVTTDKVYENREWPFGYRESDRLGGRRPV
ncbi:MAG: GDP-mannose 4,6-dehydratase [Cyanobium sp.]